MQFALAFILTVLTPTPTLHAGGLFPKVDANDSARVASDQIALGLAETGLYSALLLLKDPVLSHAKYLNRAADRLSRRLEKLNRRRHFTNPSQREIAIRNSLATSAEQEAVVRAANDVRRAEALLTDSLKAIRVASERSQMAHGDAFFNPTPFIHAPSEFLDTVTATEREEAIGQAQKGLGLAEAQLLEAITRAGGTMEEIGEFGAVGRVAELERQLKALERPNVIRDLAAKEERLALKIYRLEQKPAYLRARAQMVSHSPGRLQRAFLWRVPQALALLPVADQMMRLALYVEGRNPGIAPLATYLQAQLGGTCRTCGTNP